MWRNPLGKVSTFRWNRRFAIAELIYDWSGTSKVMSDVNIAPVLCGLDSVGAGTLLFGGQSVLVDV